MMGGVRPMRPNLPPGRRRGRLARLGLIVLVGVCAVLAWTSLAGGTQPYEAYESAVTADGPVAQFRFDDAAGAAKVADSVGSFTATNSGITLGGEGPFGGSKAGSFGGEAYATLPGDPLEGAKEWTAEAWVNWTGTTYKQPIFDFGSSATNYIYLTPAASLSTHKLLLEIHTSGGSSAQVTATKLATNGWHYLAATETSSGTLLLYEDGEQVGQTTGASVFPSSLGSTPTDYLGRSLVSGEPDLKGLLSNVAFYTKALSASQIAAHWKDAEAPVNTVAPQITGTTKDGSSLTAKVGTWIGLAPITFAYQWTRCNEKGEACANIAAGTEAKYTATHEDVGSTLRAVVTASNKAGSGTATTPATAKIEPTPPANTSPPVIAGEAKDGQLLSVSAGTWSGTPPLAYSYQWESCAAEKCSKLSGATSATYRVISSEMGKTLRATVTAENLAGSKAVKSAQTATVIAGPPVNTAPPAISGEAKDGQTLKASSAGTWVGTAPISYSYQWLRCNAKGESCTEISGATATSYALMGEDVGHAIRVQVTATNAQGSASAASEPTAAVAAIPPSNTTAPTVSGEAKDGQTLSASTGSWSGSAPISYAYQWLRCDNKGEGCAEITVATTSAYTLAHQDVGSTLRVKVTATNTGGSVSATSKQTGVIAALRPSNTSKPAISGEAKDAQTLTATSGEWSGTPPLSYSYQWLRCDAKGEGCAEISGATASSYAATPADVGDTLRVNVTAANAAGSASATSQQTAVVAALPPSNTSRPTISGEAKDGHTLTASRGAWSGTPPISYAYQWQRCNGKGESCANVSGASGETYVLSSSDVGSTVRVLVTATNSAGSSAASSDATATVVAVPPANTAAPALSGEAKDGSTLTASNGTWTGSSPLSYTYQWQRCDAKGEGCAAISGATNTGYTAAHEDVGHTVRVVVTATNAAGSASATSAASGVIAAVSPSNTSKPTTSGEAKDGQTLTASSGEWSGTPPISYAYQWQRCDAKGEGCADISAATAPTYGAGHEDVGHTLRVRVTATNAAGAVSASSDPSPIVAALAPSNTTAPTISGEAKVGQTLSVNVGAWAGTPPIAYSYQWESCNTLGEGCLAISGATGATYLVQASDVGTTLRALVTATNTAGQASLASAATTTVTGGGAACTDSWTGGAGDELWQTAGNWSAGRVPSSGDHACIGPETTVQLSGASSLASLADEGALIVDGSLELTSTAEPSAVASLTLNGGTLAGTATLHASRSLSVTGNATSSGLTLVLDPGASGSTGGECARLLLDGSTLLNEGTFTLASGSAALWVENGARIQNGGVFEDDSVDPGCGYGTIGFSIFDANTASLTNTGTFKANGGAGSPVDLQVQFDNKGAVIANGGTLELSEGGIAGQVATGSWAVEGGGTIVLTAGTFLIAEEVDLSHVRIAGATVELAGKGPPVAGAAPVLSGEADVGRTLSATPGLWKGMRPFTYAYQWKRCNSAGEGCASIGGATGASYTPIVADAGSTLQVIVTATNSLGSASSASQLTSVVGFPPVNLSSPTISGTAQDGKTLSATTGSWEGGSPISYTYQWQRCTAGAGTNVALSPFLARPFAGSGGGTCTNIEGATSSTYTLQDEDVEMTVRVLVTARDADGQTEAASAASGSVLPPAAPQNTEPPSISGALEKGHVLTATTGGWLAVGAVSFGYQWQRCNASGEGCTDIQGATSATYLLGASDVGRTLRVIVTATNAVGSPSSVSSVTGTVADSSCTDAWTGASGGSWSTPGNWSAGHAPGPSDVACIGAGTTVQITGGSNTVGQLEDEGALALSGGSLDLANAAKPSSVASVTVSHALLTGPGSLYVSASFTLRGSAELTGSGATVIQAGAVAWIEASSGCEPMTLSNGTLVNEGTLHYVWGTLEMAGGATLENIGTLEYNTQSSCYEPQLRLAGAGASAQILNTGTFKRETGGNGGIGVPFNNGGAVEAHNGRLSFSGGGVPEEVATGSWTVASGGAIALTEGTYRIAEEVDLSQVEVTGATVTRVPLEAPVSLTPPSVSGDLVAGETLSASSGTWQATPRPSYAYRWQRCNASGEECADIPGATARQYTLTLADQNATVRVRVTATNVKGSASAASQPTSVIAPPTPPTNLAAPTISGETREGQLLEASTGEWTGTPDPRFTFQWQRCDASGGACTNISGATGASYLLGHVDVGATLRAVVTATNLGGSVSTASAASAVVVPLPPVNTAAPTSSGPAEDGQTLTASTGSWEGEPVSYSYQWQRCPQGGGSCTAIGGATASTYALGHEDVGSTVRVVVTATNAGGSAESASQTSGQVVPAPPANATPPTVGGEAIAGEAVRANTGSWSGTPPFSYTYQWQSCNAGGAECAAIEGATSRSYTLASSEVDRRVRVLVTASNAAGTATEHSPATPVSPAAPPTNSKAPTIAGSALDGQTLTADPGSWEGSPPSFTYQWQSCDPQGGECRNIAGETGETYTLGAGDVGSAVRVVVTASNASGTAQATSAATAEVKPGPPAELQAPSISGVADEGETLSAHAGEWGGTETSIAFQWESCGPQGQECQAIAGATEAQYQLGQGDVGTTLRVRIQASNEEATLTALSTPTAVVGTRAPTLTNNLGPSISGTAQVGQNLTVDPGSWTGEEEVSYAFQWQRCDPSGSACQTLPGANAATLALGADEVGATLRALVTARDANGSLTLPTPATAPVANEGAPAPEEPPTVYGATIAGQTLDATPGVWAAEGAPLTFSYQWQRCGEDGGACAAIAAATASTYTLQSADVGHTLRLLVSAHDSYGQATAISSPTAIVAPAQLTPLAAPSISGGAETGHQLSAHAGIWTALGQVSYGYQWERCDASGESCSPIPGATGAAYTPAAPDLAHTLRVSVEALDGSEKQSAQSAPTATIITPDTPPENTALPSIEGVFTVGDTVTASPGSWAGAEPISYAYQWQSCAPSGQECANIESATDSSYVLAAGDAGKRVRVLVTATNALASTTASSGEGEVVGAPGPPALSQGEGPTIYGTAKQGGTLYVSNGNWSGSRPLSFQYQWERCNAAGEDCANLEAATKPSYQPQGADLGSTVRVVVTVTNTLGSEGATSPPVVVTATGQPDVNQAIELAQATDPSILAPSTEAGIEAQQLKPALGDASEQLSSSSTLTGSKVSKQTTGEFELNTPAGSLGLEPTSASQGAATLPTLVNGVAAVYAGSATATDTIVRPEPLGTATLLQLRSSAAPTSFSWRVHIGPSQRLEQLANGSIAVVEASEEEAGEGVEPGLAARAIRALGTSTTDNLARPFDSSEPEHYEGGAAEQEHGQAVSEEAPEGAVPAAPTAETPTTTPKPGELEPENTQHEYETATEALTAAEAKASSTVVMVIEAPQVKDANGNAVPASLSAQNETVTLTLAPPQGASYPLTAETAVAAHGEPEEASAQLRAFSLAASASTRGARYYGLAAAYNTREDFAESEDNHGHFDKRLAPHGSGKLHVSFARVIIPYNLLQAEPTTGWKELQEWLAVVGSTPGLRPFITFGDPTGKAFCESERDCKGIRPSAKSGVFGTDVKQEIEMLKNGAPGVPPVKYFGAWNEPDLNHGSHKYAFYNAAHEAASIWDQAEAALQASGCSGCYMLAGEFSEFKSGYTKEYKQTIVNQQNTPLTIEGKTYKPHKPIIWGMHDYHDLVHYFEHHDNGDARDLIGALKGTGPKIWLSELGVQLEGGANSYTPLQTGKLGSHPIKRRVKGKLKNETPNELQAEAADDFLALGAMPHVEMLDYYQYRPHGHAFDSALLNPTGKEPKDWREAYCVLAMNKFHGCPSAAHTKSVPLGKATATTAVAAMNVDPRGLATEYWVQYGETAAYGHQTAHIELAHETGEQSVTVSLTKLTPCTTYHYQVASENEGNEGVPSEGGDETFKTACHAVVEDPSCMTNVLPANDDNSTGLVSLPFTIDYYGREFGGLYVNNNGNVTFDKPLRQWTPYVLEASAQRAIMAPFLGDVDTRGGGSEEPGGGGTPSIASAAPALTPSIPSEVEGGESALTTYGTTTFEGHTAFCVDWPYVGYYRKHTDRLNDFQLMIVDRSDVGAGDFQMIFNYDQIRWETGDANGGVDGLGGESAVAGFSNGDGTDAHSLELPGSRVNGGLLDGNNATGLINHDHGSDVPGRYVFDVFPH
jgi:hypothetical protein